MSKRFKNGLDRALHSLEDIDPRLDVDSHLEQINAGQTRATVSNSIGQNLITMPVHTNLKAPRNIKESVDLTPDAIPDSAGAAPPEENKPQLDLGGDGGEEITDADLPPQGGQGQEPIPGMPSGNNYTVDQAKGQLDGIIKNWMDMAGNYPEGEQRHNFIELGERLREISAVINRDFMTNAKTQPTA
jgi:hypothetical protein